MRMGDCDLAERLARSHPMTALPSARLLNLLGVVHEKRQEWKLAKKFYGRAIRADRRYAPARQNMRRIYELMTVGRSDQPVAMGDERPALGRLLLEQAQRRAATAQVFAKTA